MAQKTENYRHSGEFMVFIPKDSTQITSGDVVVMPRKADPKSRSRLGTLGRVSPIASADAAPWVVGVSDSAFSSTTVGATLYASPTSNQALPVYRKGVFDLAISNTSGNAGDLIAYSSGGTGAQIFAITTKPGLAIGVLEKTFSGATANDTQKVRLIQKDMYGVDLAYWLENRVILDCTLKPISGTSQSAIGVGTTFTGNRQGNIVMIQGERFRITRDTMLTCSPTGGWTGGAVSRCKARMIVARSGGFGVRTCSGYVALTTFTKTGFSNIYFVPTTQTSGEIAIGYVVFASAVTKATAGMLFQVYGPSMLPIGKCHWAL